MPYMGMEYKKIHACPNSCIFHQKEYEHLDNYLKCKASCFKLKKNGVVKTIEALVKVLWYLTIILSYKCMFTNIMDAKYLMWHVN